MGPAGLLRMDFSRAVEVHATRARYVAEHRVSPAARAFVRVALPLAGVAAGGAAAWAHLQDAGLPAGFLAAVAGAALLLSLVPLRTLRLEADARGVEMAWGGTSRRIEARQVRAVAARRVRVPRRGRGRASVSWVLALRGDPDWELGVAAGPEELLRVAQQVAEALGRPVEREGF